MATPKLDGFLTFTVQDRFWAKVNKTEECWIWMGPKDKRGYGRFWITHVKYLLTHRFAYELLVGLIPAGLTLDHLCRTPSCVKPAHLEPVTLRDNILRGIGFGALNARKTHCPQGHPYDLFNTRHNAEGRYCRQCQQVHDQGRRR